MGNNLWFNSNELRSYLVSHVREIYKGFDDCHDERHFDEVYYFTEKLCCSLNFSFLKTDVLLTAAAFHDVGRIIGNDDHEKNSVIILNHDKFISHKFSKETIERISEIILAHRSSCVATTTEQMILKDADRASRLSPARQLYRLIAYNVTYYPDCSNYEIYKKIAARLNSDKFKIDWCCDQTEKVFGKLQQFKLPEFDDMNKHIEEYKQSRYK